MNDLELQSSLSGLTNAFAAQRNATDLIHKSLGVDAGARPVPQQSDQPDNTLLAKAVTGVGGKLNITV